MKNILQRDKQKRGKKKQQQHKHISHCSLKQNCKKGRGGGGGGTDAGGKIKYIYIYISERKQYQNSLFFVVIIYLKEAFKMGLLLIAESFESPNRSNLTFK